MKYIKFTEEDLNVTISVLNSLFDNIKTSFDSDLEKSFLIKLKSDTGAFINHLNKLKKIDIWEND